MIRLILALLIAGFIGMLLRPFVHAGLVILGLVLAVEFLVRLWLRHVDPAAGTTTLEAIRWVSGALLVAGWVRWRVSIARRANRAL